MNLKKLLKDIISPDEKTAKEQEEAGGLILGIITLILFLPVYLFNFLKMGFFFAILSPGLFLHKRLGLSKKHEGVVTTLVALGIILFFLFLLALGSRYYRYGINLSMTAV